MITVDSYLRIKPPSGFKAPAHGRSKDEITSDVIIKKLLSLSFQKYKCQDFKNVLLPNEMKYPTKPAGCNNDEVEEIPAFLWSHQLLLSGLVYCRGDGK